VQGAAVVEPGEQVLAVRAGLQRGGAGQVRRTGTGPAQLGTDERQAAQRRGEALGGEAQYIALGHECSPRRDASA
jgi:predicted ABC-type transport system involved in lysophospholipase L1 biosynthesis ATPase subunit